MEEAHSFWLYMINAIVVSKTLRNDISSICVKYTMYEDLCSLNLWFYDLKSIDL